LHAENRFQSGSKPNREGVHGKRHNFREILSCNMRMENYFKGFTVEYIERTKNTNADELAKVVAKKEVLPPDVFFQDIEDSFVKTVKLEPRMVNIIQRED
jgi:hypothetical protein